MRYVILGIIQGLTEFLPVSSSGHLVLFSHIFKIPESQIIPVIIVCHIGTLFALFCFFARDIYRVLKDLIVISQIFVVTLITGLIALTGRNLFEQLFQKPVLVCLGLLVTSVFLILTRRFTKGRRSALNIKDAIWMGVSQGFAVIPGISRSGITIFSLLARGVEPEAAFRFSFIAGIPAILGALLCEVRGVALFFNNYPQNFWLALVMSYIFGFFSLFILKRVVSNSQLHYFGYYLLPVSILGFIFTV